MNAKPETKTLIYSTQYELAQPPAKVWRALTDPAVLARWLMPNDIRPVEGHSFTFKSDPTPWWDGIVRCKVLEVVPRERIRYTWRSGSGQNELDTVVTWTLERTPSGGTLLGLEHSGFRPADGQAYEGMKKGWPRLASRLQEVLTSWNE